MRVHERLRATNLCLPFCQDSADHLRDYLKLMPSVVDPYDAAGVVEGCVENWLHWLEPHVLPSAVDLYSQSGDRYEAFFSSKELHLRFSKEYPYLAARLSGAVFAKANNVRRAIDRLSTDWDLLRATYPGLGSLIAVKDAGGDPHDGGQSTLKLAFSSGHSLIYKPRGARFHVALHSLLEQVDDNDASTLIPAIVSHEDHSWVAPTPQSGTNGSPEDYCYVLGRQLALLDCFGYMDGHFENVIATSAGLKIIDSETFLHNKNGPYLASIAETGLISAPEAPSFDTANMSALTSTGRFMSHRFQARALNDGTDDIGVGYSGYTPFASYPHRPTLTDGSVVFLSDYSRAIANGLRDGYSVFPRKVADVLTDARGTPDVSSRTILRATLHYTNTLSWLDQPNSARDEATARTIAVERLRVDTTKRLPGDVEMEEVGRLLAYDIPYFCSPVTTRDLHSITGIVEPSFFVRTSLERSESRCRAITADRDYIEKQTYLVRAALEGSSATNR